MGNVPEGVKVDLLGQLVKVSGPKGALEFNAHRDMKLSESDGTIVVERTSDVREHRSLHGTTRQMINNMVVGVSVGYSKELEIGNQRELLDERGTLCGGRSWAALPVPDQEDSQRTR